MRRLIPLMLLALAFSSNAKADRAFIIDTIATKQNASDIDWPTGPSNLPGNLEMAVIIGPVPGFPLQKIWDVVARPAVLLYIKNHIVANRWLGQTFSEIRANAPAGIKAEFFRKLVSRIVTINGQSVTIRLNVPQSDSTVGDVTITAEVSPNQIFGAPTGPGTPED